MSGSFPIQVFLSFAGSFYVQMHLIYIWLTRERTSGKCLLTPTLLCMYATAKNSAQNGKGACSFPADTLFWNENFIRVA